MFKSQGSPLWFKNGQVRRVFSCVPKQSNLKGPSLGSKEVESQGSPLGIRSVQIPRAPLGFKNGPVPRVFSCVSKLSNLKGPPLGSKVVESLGSPLGFKNGQIPRVF